MCGIFAITVSNGSNISFSDLENAVSRIFLLSESRGKEASGIAFVTPTAIEINKSSASVKHFLRRAQVRRWIKDCVRAKPAAVIGHARLATDGSAQVNANNQPVIKDGITGVHNGIIVNVDEIWRAFPGLKREYEVDTEVLLALVRYFLQQTGSLVEAMQTAFDKIRGTASLAAVFKDLPVLAMATNNGSLYTYSDRSAGMNIFASEYNILRRFLREHFGQPAGEFDLRQVRAGSGCLVDLNSGDIELFDLRPQKGVQPPRPRQERRERAIKDVSLLEQAPVIMPSSARAVEIDVKPIDALRRCSKCVLPQTMPFIEFDGQGVCNYCRNFRPIEVAGTDALLAKIERFRRANEGPDCLVTFSGGRDSSYGLHYIKSVLKMNPIAYTYDWGMITDLARRNQARICGQLGVEQILVSADIKTKRRYIRQNVQAWLNRPDLGTVPLFMAGDKQYFYYANQLKKSCGLDLTFICINPFERTNFKTGFCGVRQPFAGSSNYALSFYNQIKMALYYAGRYAANPAFINTSLLDTLGAFYSFYSIPHDHLNLFQYIMWDEQQINTVLNQEYDWEKARDTASTWRIGDGTASFYNYIYYCMAGFTENDTFRSNQIRQGLLERSQAMALVQQENRPRFSSIQWYCETIGLDMEQTLKKIQEAPKLYGQT